MGEADKIGPMSSFRPALAAAVLVGLLLSPTPQAPAQTTTPPAQTPPAVQPIVRLHYAFQPDCLRSKSNAGKCMPPREGRLDLGPQIAVWIEKEGAGYVADLLVTNLVAKRG